MTDLLVNSQSKKSVLLVEDEPAVRRYFEAVLQVKYSVQTAPDAETALTIMKEYRPDVLLTDWDLPGKSGLDLIKIAQQQHTGLVCIVMSGKMTEDRVKEASDAGAHGTLYKPLNRLNELYTLIEACLKSAS